MSWAQWKLNWLIKSAANKLLRFVYVFANSQLRLTLRPIQAAKAQLMLLWFVCVTVCVCVHSCVKCVRNIVIAFKVPVTQVTWQKSDSKRNALHISKLADNTAQAKSTCFHSLKCSVHCWHSLRSLPVSAGSKEKALRALLLIKRRRRRRHRQRQQQSKT